MAYTQRKNRKNKKIIKEKKLSMYIISNPAFPGWLKIGRSYNVFERLKIYQIADPLRRYKLEFYLEVKDCKVHEKCFKDISKIEGEWINCSLDVAISVMKSIEGID